MEPHHITPGEARMPGELTVRAFCRGTGALASFAAATEFTFGTIVQRVMAWPGGVRFHYGHPDLWNRLFVMTRGGVSKATRYALSALPPSPSPPLPPLPLHPSFSAELCLTQSAYITEPSQPFVPDAEVFVITPDRSTPDSDQERGLTTIASELWRVWHPTSCSIRHLTRE